MAGAELSQSLLDIISSLTQDDIPFKLRCAICNNLAINAFRLPCCDQAICESCQASLPESCPVCEHNPVSPDLCKPNKALRTTLKAFLRTEEKKREKDRPPTTPTVTAAPAAVSNVPVEAKEETAVSAPTNSDNAVSEEAIPAEPASAGDIEKTVDENDAVTRAPPLQENGSLVPADKNEIDPTSADSVSVDAKAIDSTDAQPSQSEGETNPVYPNMGVGMAQGMMPGMGWAGQDMGAMAKFMPAAMGNFQNTMGMPGMGPMNAAQGMFGGFGMTMNNMSNGMNMGYGTEQQMYNNWDNSQNNMYNPNPYSNGMGQDYGASGYAGYINGNYSQMQQYPNQNFQNGYYGNGPGYMRGVGRGRGRGYYRGRGGYDHANYYQQNYRNNVSQGPMNQEAGGQTEDDIKRFNNELAPGGGGDDYLTDGPPKDSTTITGPENGKDSNVVDSTDRTDMLPDSNINGEPAGHDGDSTSQLQGIPTIDSIDNDSSMDYSRGPMPVMDHGYGRGRGFGRGGFMTHRGGFYNINIQGPPTGQGVAGAPVAPRAMREGGNRSRFSGSRRTASISQTAENSSRGATPSIAQENMVPHSPSVVEHKTCSPSPSRERSPRRSHPQSPPTPESRQSRAHRRDRSESAHDSIDDDKEARKDRHGRSHRDERDFDSRSQSRSRSPSQTARRSSHRSGKDGVHKSSHRSSRLRRRGSRSESRHRDRNRGSATMATNGDDKYDLARRITNAQRLGKGSSSSRHEKESRKRDRHESDRGTDRERDRRRERDKPRDRDHERDRGKDRKRSRRERSQSGDESDSSHRHSRPSKRSHRDGGYDVVEKESSRPSERESDRTDSSKDPHTLEREARNRERLVKEKQRRDAMTTEHRDSRNPRRQHESGRRLNYKYEGDDDDMSRVEKEREAGRWR
ncbi:conserved hypothetical protein [Talaromyces stipitatus ATCC 10500]|uniref:RING-type domain-containing protein n=1 Tax=Talaromyces stipitatus (strain ATCC 10500 / CBS 375.48 / QM 6759 / NRRL 1006) TaxID=441959 RepID=B8M7U7_TALSN|nr:uncharacterized protein TSTA_030890 [Talaromyces stipitatus ATCC 10500]EED19826.1 conserved hypothetical protein [Talaromyces stipitatus ATCC 10500]